MRMRPVVVGVLAVGLLTTSACSSDPPATREVAAGSSTSAQPDVSATTQRPSGPVPPILSFTADALNGTRFDAASLAGRPVLLWFWAPWCATCAGQAASVSDVSAKYKEKLGILGVAGLGDKAAMDKFVAELEVAGVTHVNDKTGGIWKRFSVAEQSTYVMLDASGKMVHRGWLDDVEFNKKIAALTA